MKKVFVVEDDMDLLQTLSLLLKEEGHKVWSFNTAKPVYGKIKNLVPDTMILDVWLPGSRGDRLASFIKNNKKYSQTKVLLISAGDGLATLARKSKADGYLKKPFSVDELLNMI